MKNTSAKGIFTNKEEILSGDHNNSPLISFYYENYTCNIKLQVGAEALKKTIEATAELDSEGELLATVEYHQVCFDG